MAVKTLEGGLKKLKAKSTAVVTRRKPKGEDAVAALDSALRVTEGNLRGAMEQVVQLSQKLEASRLEAFRKTVALQQANKGITRLHAKMDRMRNAFDREYAGMKRNMNVAARLIRAVETGALKPGQNPEQHFRFREHADAIEFANKLAGVL